jgi:hypothetical protein
MPGSVRRKDGIREGAQRTIVRQRLLLIDIEHSCEPILAQLCDKGLFVYNGAARRVDEQGTILDQGKLLRTNQVPGFG